MKAIAVQDVWNHITQQTVPVGQEFELPEEQMMALIRVGAAKLPDNNEANPGSENNPEVGSVIEPKTETIAKPEAKPEVAIVPDSNTNTEETTL